jgi:Bifunctional DNA primase/polymerase, N-terminal/Primase C terminal 1 (PriCT-1)
MGALDELLRMAAHGWRLFPCAPHAKTPLLKGWPTLASCDAAVIRRWAQEHANCNWGVACGPTSAVWVLDVDGEKGNASLRALVEQHGEDWTRTLAVTTRRGQHFYFAYPPGTTIKNSTQRVGPGLDVRGTRGYALVPPSIHPSGARYEWTSPLNGCEPAAAPAWLLEMVTSGPELAVKAREISILPQGHRNDGLTRLAGAMRRRGAQASEIEIALLEANIRRCRPPLIDAEVRKIAASASRWAPGGPDPLETAWKATDGDYTSNYERFLALGRQLQLIRPGQTIALPLKRIATLMGIHWTTVSIYRRNAVTDGLLEPAGEYIPHRRAGLYRIPEKSETLTKTLTSGLVRISENSLVRIH